MPIELPSDIATLLGVWDASSLRYSYGGYALVTIGVLSSLAVTSFTDALSKVSIKVLGFVAAACTALLASFHPIETGNAFRDAWRVLNAAAISYKLNENQRDPAKLVEAMKEGEVIIARVQGSSGNLTITKPSGQQ